MKRGQFIVFEGVSGTGKETQAILLQKYLTEKSIPSHLIYHPSPELKDIMMGWRKTRGEDRLSDVYLLLADRSHWMRTVVLPALKKGEWVISLRSWISALVYQGTTKDEREFIEHEFSHVEPDADVLFYFDLEPHEAMKRINKRHQDTGEPLGDFEAIKKLDQNRKGYINVLKGIPHVKLNAAHQISEIHTQILQSINRLKHR